MMAAGAALLCAACGRSVTVEYGTAIVPDAGGQTGGASDALPDAKK